MTAAYFDSSVLLAILFRENTRAQALERWHSADIRCSSILLKFEALTVLRRAHAHNRQRLGENWFAEKTAELNRYASTVNLLAVDEPLLNLFAARTELGGCRTLDAIHLASALFFRQLNDEKLTLHTFDAEMQKLALRCGFDVPVLSGQTET